MPLTLLALKTAYQNMITNDGEPEFIRILNEADERLLFAGRWGWTFSRLDLTPTAGYVELPLTHDSILGARIQKRGRAIQSQEIEFSEGGPGEIEIGGCSSYRLVDQGYTGTGGARRYKIAGGEELEDDIAVLARFAPAAVSDDTDTVLCPDRAALKNAMLAIVYEEDNELERSRIFMANAQNLLDRREKSSRGGARVIASIQPWGPDIGPVSHMR